MKCNLFSIVIVLLFVLLGLACSSQATPAPAASATPNASQAHGVEDQVSLIDALRSGAEVEIGDAVGQSLLHRKGTDSQGQWQGYASL